MRSGADTTSEAGPDSIIASASPLFRSTIACAIGSRGGLCESSASNSLHACSGCWSFRRIFAADIRAWTRPPMACAASKREAALSMAPCAFAVLANPVRRAARSAICRWPATTLAVSLAGRVRQGGWSAFTRAFMLQKLLMRGAGGAVGRQGRNRVHVTSFASDEPGYLRSREKESAAGTLM